MQIQERAELLSFLTVKAHSFLVVQIPKILPLVNDLRQVI